ncbi:hypothetical protein Forpe1208_v017055 [Fusarium oxysporum f. sp. rapae]|uniref:Uncharacterized protein n=1 Tax=Fusarium oxysporum f. sp. rapae TaxID=485398 RepID=A0A8J5NEK2_FUSOX|nr:hypothetical protein Forpe1208_v017066 [Fusarium oxysporum f. sp. rapae]KAG7402721.1 hypothetical protein Forpe1208_v017055 [Fusarium oxysporum f. sp. rapae]
MATSQSSTAINTRQKINRRKRRRPRVFRPDKNSLYDILHQHAGESLFVLPICWTDSHSLYLGVEWRELPPCDTPQPPDSPGTPPSRGHLNPSSTINRLIAALDQILEPDPDSLLSKNSLAAIETVLGVLWRTPFSEPRKSPKLHLYFGSRVYHGAVGAQFMWNLTSKETASSFSSSRSVSTVPSAPIDVSKQSSPNQSHFTPSIICYVGKPQVASARRKCFRVKPGSRGSQDEHVLRLQERRHRKIDPSNSDKDAYFIAVFLAMAQKHFYTTLSIRSRYDLRLPKQQDIPSGPNFHDLKLRILTHDVDKKDFIVYTGYITREFLQKFHNPFKAPADDEDAAVSGLKIEYTRVPIWPILGLRERLGKALGPDVVGAFNPDEMETWETDPETDPETDSEKQNGKRRRPSISPQAVQKEAANKRNKR